MKLHLLLTALLLVAACSSGIAQDDAEALAQDFVRERVRFFERDGESAQNVSQVMFDSVNSYKDGDAYVVALHVVAAHDSERDGSLTVTVGRDGTVRALNGQPLTE